MIGEATWRFANPVQLVFGTGSIRKLPQLAPWDPILLVTTPGAVKRRSVDLVLDLLVDREVAVHDMVTPGPQLSVLEQAATRLKKRQYQGIVAFGGGSAIDTAKTLSYLLNAPTDALRRHFESGESLHEFPRTPVLAVQTAAGTGAEVTPFATIWDTARYQKYSLGPPDLYPTTALLDPELTLSLPKDLTLSAGLDALCQGLESLWSRGSNPVAASFACPSVKTSLQVLPELVDDLDNLDLRARMLEASLLAGLAIASTKTTLSHSISYPITLSFGVLHGLACAFTIVQVLRFNAAIDDGRLLQMAQTLGFASTEALACRLDELLLSTGALEQLAAQIPSKPDLLALAPRAINPGRADNNPRQATYEEVEKIMASAWDQASEAPKIPSTGRRSAATLYWRGEAQARVGRNK